MKLQAVPITLREANDFVENFHRHNGRTTKDGGRFAIGVSDGSELWGVAIVGRPVARLLQDGVTAEVVRCCVREGAPKGSNSFLYGHCWQAWRAMGGTRMITYTLKSEGGASLRGAGWRVVGEVPPVTEESRPWAHGRNDGIKRDWQPIYGQLKFRWEVSGEQMPQDTSADLGARS